jgi:mono/diheme cytochrome c family protein
MSRPAGILTGILSLVGAIAVVGAIAFAAGGISARAEPSALETSLARAARHWLIPRSARAAANPIAASEEVLDSALRHWADHCASCHGNDGRGDTAQGRSFYPPAPDMTLPPTQELSDGELFWIIENGIRFTGMPAWGDPASPEDDAESWELVHFIRRLDELGEDELERMERLNPVSREEVERQIEIERFLAGEPVTPRSEPAGDHHH